MTSTEQMIQDIIVKYGHTFDIEARLRDGKCVYTAHMYRRPRVGPVFEGESLEDVVRQAWEMENSLDISAKIGYT